MRTNRNHIDEILKFKRNFSVVNTENAEQVLKSFQDDWSGAIGQRSGGYIEGSEVYADALLIAVKAICKTRIPSKEMVEKFSKKIDEYAGLWDTRPHYNKKQILYFNIGCCWYKLGRDYEENAINAFKKYIFNILSSWASISCGSFEAYCFKRCSGHLFAALENDKIDITSPEKFNDPFDCPIIQLFDKDNDIARLLRKAYVKALKFACFTSNLTKDPARAEYLHPLMWAHYGGNHTGVCIKYVFNDTSSIIGGNSSRLVVGFRDVKYSNEALRSCTNKSSIKIEDAFFLKGKDWEYERERRLFHFSLTDSEDEYNTYGDTTGCIEAVYFGLKCKEENIKKIREILKNKSFKRNLRSRDIKLFQIVMNKNSFGELKAVRMMM